MSKQSLRTLYFLFWEKIKKIQNSKFISENRRKVIIGSFIIIFIFFSYLYYSQSKIASLEKLKNRNSLELSILKDSVSSSNKLESDNKALIEKLSNRVDRIIRTGDDIQIPNYQTQPASTILSGATANTTPNTVNATQINNTYVTPTPMTTTVYPQGQIEIYDDATENISLYQDATTFSKIVGTIKKGTVVDFYKYIPGWYEIKNSTSNDLVWILEKNARHK